MKKIVSMFMILSFLLSPNFALAHTGLSTSNPAINENVTQEVNRITLTFKGEVEPLSTMELKKDGAVIPLQEVKINKQEMSGMLKESLENGTYTVHWSIVGKDGHPITGEIPFSVEQKTEKEPQKEARKETKVTENKENKEANEAKKPVIIGIGILSMMIIVIYVRRKK